MDYSTLLVPLLLAFVALVGMGRGVNVYDAIAKGAEEGLAILIRILPALVGLMTAVYMLRASGAMDLFGQLLAPLLDRLGIPPLFQLIQREGNIPMRDMYNTFNMGTGMVLAVDSIIANDVIKMLKTLGEEAYVLGEVVKGNGVIL